MNFTEMHHHDHLIINDSCIGVSLIQDSRLSYLKCAFLCVDIISAEPKNLGVMYLLYMGEETTEESSTDIIDISGIHNHITPL